MNTYVKLKSLNVIKDLISRDELVTKCHRLEKRFDIAKKALKEIIRTKRDFDDDPMNKIGFLALKYLYDWSK